MENVFTRLGYKIQHVSNHENNDNNTIDVMWHHLYPYKELEILKMIQNVAKVCFVCFITSLLMVNINDKRKQVNTRAFSGQCSKLQ